MEYKIENGKLKIDSFAFEIDNLTFIEEIGSGANAYVFLARNALLNRNEAVKVWIPHKGRSGVDPKRFEAEVQKNACFDGISNIAKLYDAACSDGIYYARLQYIEGQILKDYLVSKRELSDRLNIIEKILLTLKAAYEKGVYHGDLHGENIIVKNNEPFIIDFGTSLFSGEDKSHKRDCRMIIGTAQKILPELNDFDFFDKSVFMTQDSEIIIELLLNLSRLVWDTKHIDYEKFDKYTYREFYFRVHSLQYDFKFLNVKKIDSYIKSLSIQDSIRVKRGEKFNERNIF